MNRGRSLCFRDQDSDQFGERDSSSEDVAEARYAYISPAILRNISCTWVVHTMTKILPDSFLEKYSGPEILETSLPLQQSFLHKNNEIITFPKIWNKTVHSCERNSFAILKTCPCPFTLTEPSGVISDCSAHHFGPSWVHRGFLQYHRPVQIVPAISQNFPQRISP